MNEKLKNYLMQFKTYTIQMIEDLQKDKFDDFEEILDNRQKILYEINKLDFDRDEAKEIFDALNITEVNDHLAKMISDKKDKIKEKMLSLKKSHLANNAYGGNAYTSVIFSKKV